MIPNTKRLKAELNEFNAENKKLKVTMGTLVVMGWCVFLIIIATFTQFDFNHYILQLPAQNGSIWKLKHCLYIPQVPVILFIAALIGKRFGMTSVMIYILLGLLFFPVFALGGGLEYIFQYNFGYILAYLPAVYITAFMLKDKFNYATIAKADIMGVATIHIIGVFYLILMAIIHQDSFSNVASWIVMQSGAKILYDLVFGYLAILISKPVKHVLWLSMG